MTLNIIYLNGHLLKQYLNYQLILAKEIPSWNKEQKLNRIQQIIISAF